MLYIILKVISTQSQWERGGFYRTYYGHANARLVDTTFVETTPSPPLHSSTLPLSNTHPPPPPPPPPHLPANRGSPQRSADGRLTFYTPEGGFLKLTKFTDYSTKANGCKWPYHGVLYIILKLISKQKRWYVVHSLPVHKEYAGENLYIKETNRH